METKEKKYLAIQQTIVLQYRIKLNPKSDCWGRTHAHIKKRMVCKWKPANSINSTFLLAHEIGHIENNRAGMRRCEEEYYATIWAIKELFKHGIVPTEYPKIIYDYQKYIDNEYDRGVRRGGNLPPKSNFDLMKFIGTLGNN